MENAPDVIEHGKSEIKMVCELVYQFKKINIYMQKSKSKAK